MGESPLTLYIEIMVKIYPREINVVIANNRLAMEVFEKGIGLTIKHEAPTAILYKLNQWTNLRVWTDGEKHPISHPYLQFTADKETILRAANVLQNWSKGITFKRMKDSKGRSFLVLRINLPEGTDISLSDRLLDNNL